ncbi:hypothetical protein AFERRI_430004 [Acidithiobacillus ferrivorans]|uniref:Uncharacterized protein n=1 Tax=Acidithiobacillus ferrivorans TaxID=160808 RepID=A0A060UQL0_9PROT|nr:hypothetical protein AFERRI_430004 [Acidithiobacillus ferrivorans]
MRHPREAGGHEVRGGLRGRSRVAVSARTRGSRALCAQHPDVRHSHPVRVDRRVGLSVLEQLIKREADLFGDLTEQDWGDASTLMKRNRCAAACGIAELFV